MTTPEPDVPVERSLPGPEELADELEASGEAPELAAGQEPTTDRQERPVVDP